MSSSTAGSRSTFPCILELSLSVDIIEHWQQVGDINVYKKITDAQRCVAYERLTQRGSSFHSITSCVQPGISTPEFLAQGTVIKYYDTLVQSFERLLRKACSWACW